MKTIYKYIQFDLIEQRKKTQVYDVRNIIDQYILGYIKWNGAWRQYIFEPSLRFATIYSVGCLLDICDFIIQLMEERK